MTDSHYPSIQLVGETERMFSAATGKNCTILQLTPGIEDFF